VGSSPWALCGIGRTPVEGLLLCTIAQEVCEPSGDRAGGNKNEQKMGRLRELELFRLRKRRQKKDILRGFICLKGRCKEKGNNLLLVGSVRGNGLKLHQGGKTFLMVTLVRHSFVLQRV